MAASKLDAHALLTSQGWRGAGHSLHPTSDDTGLKHHLLIRREGTDGRGLGSGRDQRKAEAWWLNAFDQALRGIDTGGAGGGLRQTVPGARLELNRITARGAAKYTGARGLYTCFVRGGLLRGSAEVGEGGLLTPPDSGAATPAVSENEKDGRGDEAGKKKDKKEKKEKKDKKDKKARKEKKEEEEVKEETKEERRARRAEKKQKKEQEAEEKTARKEAKRKVAAKAEKKALKAQKKAAKESLKAGETREERRARRQARRAKKEEKRRRRKDSEG